MVRLIPFALVLLLIAACSANTADRETVDNQQAHYAKTQPVPFFDYSLDRDVLIQIYEAKNESRQTTSIIESFTGDPLFTCPSIGYGIPADTQLTNPIAPYTSASTFTVEQAEPNGLYSSKNTDATYILCIRENGDIAPVYTEEKVTVFPFGVEADENGLLSDVGDESSITVELGE